MARQEHDFPAPRNRRTEKSPPMLGDWVLERKLGQGGFGTVFLAFRADRRSGIKERAAIKVINGHLREQDDYSGHVARFLDEFKILKRLDSPYCAKVLDGDVAADNPWMATQFVSGDSLAEEIRHEGPLPVELWWHLATDLLNGLSEAHKKGIIHRDIKPQNIMRGVRGSVLIDFGIAKLAGNPKLTAAGSPMTPGFASPEQLMGKELTPASDLYSLGHTLLFAATGRLGFPSENIQSLVAGILNGKPDLSGVDAKRAQFILQLMSQGPSARLSALQALSISQGSVGAGANSNGNSAAGSQAVKTNSPVRKGIGNVRVFRPKRELGSSAGLRAAPKRITARISPRASTPALAQSGWEDFERNVLNFLIRAGRSQFLLPISTGNRKDIYFQGFFDADGRMTLEAVSNSYLDVKLTEGQIKGMVALGWELPSEALPNFIKFLDLDGSKKPRVAKLIVESLKLAYEVSPQDLCIDES